MDKETGTYSRGDQVPEDGKYVCVPCGYHHTYHQGEAFGECISCLSGSDEAEEGLADGSEMWEKAVPEEKE